MQIFRGRLGATSTLIQLLSGSVMAGMLAGLLDSVTLVFAVSSMLSVGLAYRLQDILRPLRNVGAVIRALVANFMLVPLLALFVVRILALDEPLAIGLMLIATAAGAPFLIKLTTTAGGDVGLSATLLVLLLPLTVLYMPFVVALLVPAGRVSIGAVAAPLVGSMLLPLGLGLLVNARASSRAQRLQTIMARTSSYTLVALVALTLLTNLPEMLDVRMRAILAALLVVGGAFAIGYLLGGPGPAERGVLALGTGQRNIAAATVVTTQSVGDPDTLIMVITASMVGLAVLFPMAAKLRELDARRREQGGAVTAAAGLTPRR